MKKVSNLKNDIFDRVVLILEEARNNVVGSHHVAVDSTNNIVPCFLKDQDNTIKNIVLQVADFFHHDPPAQTN